MTLTSPHVHRAPVLLLTLVASGLLNVATFAAPVPESAYRSILWRSVGTMRAGWSTAVEGVPGAPNVFYFGAADGGVWKTTDAGRTWSPLFQDASASAIGALALAPSDPRVVYVGTGQVTTRWDVTYGDGVYRSDDGGLTWRHVGLPESRHIGRIWVDPRNPDVLLVAALGHLFGPNQERGVFRSEDAGQTWQRVLYVDAGTGAVDLAGDPAVPDVLFAATWQARRYPWQAYFTPMVGPGSGIWKSTDGGRSWHRLTDGLPAGPLGRIGLAVSPGTDARRVWATVAAATGGGLYRSDDGGESWHQVNDERSLASAYFGRLTADPKDPGSIWVTGRSLRRSTDGGESFTYVKGSPGGDDYHFLWIDPADPRRMAAASDQGTSVTVNGGDSWSSWYNQPTGQLYHVATDDRFPYWIYAGQQDNGTVAVASRSDYGQLTFRDWHPVGGDERDYDIPFPGDPDIVFGSGLGGRLSRWDARTGQVQTVSPWPVSSYGARPTTVQYRSTWITVFAISRVPPHALYLGAQVVFRSTDQGQTWQVISPDLTGADPAHAGDCSGDVPVERARACGYGVVSTLAPSPVDSDLLWVGTDDGLVQLTRDGGVTWSDVTPPGLTDWSRVAQVEASPNDPGTAYIAVDRHRADDFHPYAYRTHDYGKSWTKIALGLPAGAYVNVVRQDPVRRGLLYAGTSRGAWVSFNDGDLWQPLQMHLPTTGVNDLTVHGDDLVAATQGRGLWVLDDITPLRHLSAVALSARAFLVPPAKAFRLRANSNRDTPLPPDEPTRPNPPTGAVIDYVLPLKPIGPVTLEILDDRGNVVRSFASDRTPELPEAERYFPDSWVGEPRPLPAEVGHNRFVWDLRYPRPRAIRYEYSIAAVPGADTPALPQGAFAPPGRYEVRLTVEGRSFTEPLTVTMDPREEVAPGTLTDLLAFQRRVGDLLARVTDAYGQVDAAARRLKELPATLQGKRGTRRLLAEGARLAPEVERFHGGGGAEDLSTIGDVLATLATDLEAADRLPTQPQRKVCDEYGNRLERALAAWEALRDGSLAQLDRKLGKNLQANAPEEP